MKKLLVSLVVVLLLAGCAPKVNIPADLNTFIQAGYEQQITLIKAKDEVPVKFRDQVGNDPVMGWCVAYESKDANNEVWKYESLYTQVDGKWIDVGEYNDGLAVFPPGIIMDHRWCDY